MRWLYEGDPRVVPAAQLPDSELVAALRRIGGGAIRVSRDLYELVGLLPPGAPIEHRHVILARASGDRT